MTINTITEMISKASDPQYHRQKEAEHKKAVEQELKRRTKAALDKLENPDLIDLIAEMTVQVQIMKEANKRAIAVLDKAIDKEENK